MARSTIKAEYQALAHITSELFWLTVLLAELGFTLRRPSIIWCDNQSAASLTANPVLHQMDQTHRD